MTTKQFSERIVNADGVNISIDYNEPDGHLTVKGVHAKKERYQEVTLAYDFTGIRKTEIASYEPPFDADFYSQLDAKLLKVSQALSIDIEGSATMEV